MNLQKEPPYSLVHIECKEKLTFSSLSPVAYSSYQIPCSSDKEFSISVDGQDFIGAINALSAPMIKISFRLTEKKIIFQDKGNRKITIRCTNKPLKIPQIKDKKEVEGFAIKESGIQYLISTAKKSFKYFQFNGNGI